MVVLNNTVSVHFCPTSKTSLARGNVLVDYVDYIDFMILIFVKTLQKAFGKTKCVAFLFGAAIQYKYIHISTLYYLDKVVNMFFTLICLRIVTYQFVMCFYFIIGILKSAEFLANADIDNGGV